MPYTQFYTFVIFQVLPYLLFYLILAHRIKQSKYHIYVLLGKEDAKRINIKLVKIIQLVSGLEKRFVRLWLLSEFDDISQINSQLSTVLGILQKEMQMCKDNT